MPSKIIKSPTNPLIKRVVRLRNHRQRVAESLTIVEGNRELDRMVESGNRIEAVFVCPELCSKKTEGILNAIDSLSVERIEVTVGVFKKISYGDRAGGILALMEVSDSISLGELSLPKDPVVLVLDRVEKPGNLGAILRTSDAAGVNAVIVTGVETDIFNPNVIRASVGAIFDVPVVLSTVDEAAGFLKARQIPVCVSATDTKKTIYQCDFLKACAIVLGAEHAGVSDEWIKHADQILKIPMTGHVDSLNVSVSAAILVYEIFRQRLL